MNYFITSEQLTSLAFIVNKIVANWDHKNEILRILWAVSYQHMPSEPEVSRHLFGRWG
jgi:hypothetical protein